MRKSGTWKVSISMAVNEAGNYTKPKMRKSLFRRIKAKGKQFVAQPKAIARKVRKYRT